MSIQKLRSHWGFTRTPFTKDLAPSMLHRHPGHAEAVARIAWCVEEAAVGLITGEVGAGKTVAVRAALGELDSSRHTVVYLGNPAVGARGLYMAIVTRLGGVPRFYKAALIPQVADALAVEVAERGRRVVLVVDEAHLLAADQLEELRLLTLCRARDYAEEAAAGCVRPLERRLRLDAARHNPAALADPLHREPPGSGGGGDHEEAVERARRWAVGGLCARLPAGADAIGLLASGGGGPLAADGSREPVAG